MNTVYFECSKSGQHADYAEILTTEDKLGFVHKLRVRIHTDTHRGQMRADITRWDGAQWHEVWRLDTELMKSDTHTGYQREPITAGAFMADRDALVARAREILVG